MHDALRLTRELRDLRDPLILAAFWGWGDGTGSAMGTVRYLRSEWGATEIATVDPDRFYDLTVARPRVTVRNGERHIRWPGARFHLATPPGSERDVVLIAGREPSLAWREFAEMIADFMTSVGARHYLSLGSRPAMTPHTRPAPLLLADADTYFEELMDRTSERSGYQGPTGVGTIVSLHLQQSGFSTGRLTALVPGYVNIGPNPRAMMSLIEQVDRALGSQTSVEALQGEVESYDSQTDSALGQLADPEQMRDQIQQMEEQFDAGVGQLGGASMPATGGGEELPSGDELLEGIESFLRQQRSNPGADPDDRRPDV